MRPNETGAVEPLHDLRAVERSHRGCRRLRLRRPRVRLELTLKHSPLIVASKARWVESPSGRSRTKRRKARPRSRARGRAQCKTARQRGLRVFCNGSMLVRASDQHTRYVIMLVNNSDRHTDYRYICRSGPLTSMCITGMLVRHSDRHSAIGVCTLLVRGADRCLATCKSQYMY